MDPLRIALAQINGTVGDIGGNAEQIVRYIDEARSHGADLVVFPELALTGFPPGDLLLRSAFVDANQNALRALAKQTRGITVVIGFVEHERTAGLYNAAAVLHDGTLAGISRKARLASQEIFEEMRYFQAGPADSLYRIAGHQVGITIGQDLSGTEGGTALRGHEFDDLVVGRLAGAGADLIVNLAAMPFHRGSWRDRYQALTAAAKQYGVAIAYVNRVGGQDELVFDGGSLVCTAAGTVIAEAQPFHEELLLCDLPATGSAPREESDATRSAPTGPGELRAPSTPLEVGDAAAGDRGTLVLKPLDHAPRTELRPPLAPRAPVCHDDLAETYQALTLGIRDYARKNGFRHLTMGLSGGLDSALVATLAADALGAAAVTGVWMPSRYSSEVSRVDAVALAENLGIALLTIPIEPAFHTFMQLLEPHFGGRGPDLTEENLQARIRGVLLMGLSNKFGWLVLSTSNKSETAVGYSTLYGDMVGGLAVLKDLTKTLVSQLARWRNTESTVIPTSTIERPPTAELRPDQADTDSLPPYDVLDPILVQYLEHGWSVRKIIAGGAEPATVHRIIGLVNRGEYKRRQAAPGIRVTTRAFGVDDRMPMTSYFQED